MQLSDFKAVVAKMQTNTPDFSKDGRLVIPKSISKSTQATFDFETSGNPKGYQPKAEVMISQNVCGITNRYRYTIEG